MPTINPRINITLEAPVIAMLTQLADKEHKSISGLARELLLEAIELREDMLLSEIGDKLYVKGAKTISHDEIWK